MKMLQSVLFVGCVFMGLLISILTTFVAWNMQIESRAFQCWDGPGMDAYWGSIDDHEGAGDKISPGWTWGEIRNWREVYVGAFFVIWAASSGVSFRLMSRGPRQPTLSLEPIAVGSADSTTRPTLQVGDGSGPAR